MKATATLAALLPLLGCAAPGEPQGIDVRIDLEPPATPAQDPDLPQEEGFGPDLSEDPI